MAINDIYQVVLKGQTGATFQENRFWYLALAGSDSAADLAEAVETTMVSIIADIVTSSTDFIEVRVTNWDAPSDQDTRTFSIPGTRTGDFINSFYVAAFEMSPANALVGLGRKAFGRVSESDITNGNPSPSYQIALDAATAIMEATLFGLSGANYGPALFSPANMSHAFDIKTSIVAVPFKRMSTQSSRKNF